MEIFKVLTENIYKSNLVTHGYSSIFKYQKILLTNQQNRLDRSLSFLIKLINSQCMSVWSVNESGFPENELNIKHT